MAEVPGEWPNPYSLSPSEHLDIRSTKRSELDSPGEWGQRESPSE